MDRDTFEQLMGGMASTFMTVLNTRVGQRVGLMEQMTNDPTPATSQELAERTHLKERYVREWLGAMVAARIVTMRTENGSPKYFIDQTHLAGIRTWCSYIPTMVHFVERMDAVVECFKKDGPYGFGYDKFSNYIESWNSYREENTAEMIDAQLQNFKNIGLAEKLDRGIKCLDIGCGPGMYAICFASRFPNSTFIGVDNDVGMIQKARSNAMAAGINNVTFQMGDICSLPADFTESFDMVLATNVIHNLPDPMLALSEVGRVLSKNSVLSMIEPDVHSQHADNIGNTGAAFHCSVSIFECLPNSMSQEPHVGYGAGWGQEALTAAVATIPLSIVLKDRIMDMYALHYICVKT